MPDDPNIGNGTETTFGGTDASTPPLSSLRGSPLCGVTPGRCLPDDGARQCVDADEVSPASDTSTTDACRIARRDDDSFGAECLYGQADLRGVDGVACETGAACAPGFDCIDGEIGGVCRRYCCSGSCSQHLSLNGGPTFCDVQKVVDTHPHKAPVCMPLKKCQLLTPGECSRNETCAIVTEKGDSGCVAMGTANVDDSCDEEHCAADLTCLGNPGDRRCYKLCKVDGSDCGPTQTCMTGAVFQNTAFGVCKGPK